jgi:5-methylthioadenosine/S-adenosylhomocysteine deaminase
MPNTQNPPIDPLTGPKLALSGRVVTMDATFRAIDEATVYIEAGRIIAVRQATDAVPPGFENVPVVATAGTIYPGLIDLHNHMAYNALRLWNVPKTYKNRDQWGGISEYRKRISGPMKVIGMTTGLLPAVVRYVECKCLIAGVTTGQGIALFSNAGARRYWRGLVRNVEETSDLDLPEAAARIADVNATDVNRFFTQLRRQTCSLLHLSEGTDEAARRHFLALKMADGAWAINDALAGIHCTALKPEDFAVLGQQGASMVWSPMSNLLLYGKTANISAARDANIKIGLGCDWSPTGSKNLLGELKAAHLVNQTAGAGFTARDLVAMVTRNAAAILKWQSALGSLEAGKRADLIVVDNISTDPYTKLIHAKEKDMKLVMINGVPRFGWPKLMSQLGVTAGETVTVDREKRTLFLEQPTADPDVNPVSLAAATAKLTDALHHMPELAVALERTPLNQAFSGGPLSISDGPLVWQLALDELTPTGMTFRPRLDNASSGNAPSSFSTQAALPLSEILQPMLLDPLTVADDPEYLTTISGERNLTPEFKTALNALY